jgi:phosphatidylinositol 3-kinase
LKQFIPETATMFSSATQPMLLEFRDIKDKVTKIIYKKSDDLRGDQIIMQMISLMDFILKSVGVDLRLTVYNVVVFSRDDGLVEFVPSITLQDVLENNNQSLAQFFRKVTDKKISELNELTTVTGMEINWKTIKMKMILQE